jgi:hypothetical protein
MALDRSGNTYLGSINSPTSGIECGILTIGDDGVEEWSTMFVDSEMTSGTPVAIGVDAHGNAAVIIISWRAIRHGSIIGFDSSGVERWSARFDGPGNSTVSASALAFDGSGNVYASGISTRPYWSAITMVKYAQTFFSVEENEHQQPKAFELIQNYPNPFNPRTVVSYQLPEAGVAKLVVYDLLGREVVVLVNERKEPGMYSATLDATRLASGIYFYRLTAGEFYDVKKMVLIR